MNKNTLKSDQTKQALRDAFIRLYEQKDIRSISIRDITELAGYNRGTFYLYYLDIYDLFEQIKSELLSQLARMAEEILSGAEGITRGGMTTLLLRFYSRNEKYVVPLMERDAAMLGSIIDVLRPVFFSRLGDLSHEERREVEYLLQYHFAAVINVINYWVRSGKDISREEMAGIVYEAAAKGVLTVFQDKRVF